MRDSMVVYRSFLDALRELDAEDGYKVMLALMEYALDDIEPDLSGVPKAMFSVMKPLIDNNNTRYRNGLKGGRNKTEQQPKSNQTTTKVEPNNNQNLTKAEPKPNQTTTNDNVNDNDNDNVNDNDKYIYCASCKEIIDYLNQKTGKNFSDKSDASRRLIKARLNEGRTVEDFKKVIDIKSKQWLKDEKMNRYLQPSTLFSTKFEGYLNEKEIIPVNGFAGRNYDFEGLEKQLLGY